MTTNWRAIRDTTLTTLAGALLAASGAFLTAHTAAADETGNSDRIGDGICYKKLPPEAHDTFKDIWSGGPYDYPDKDGTIFQNRDDNPLPRHENGYYHEFTVKTPGLDHRGAKRIVTGGDEADKEEDYYTKDHYETFDLVDHTC